MGRATNICSTFHTPHHALFRRWRVVHSVHASSRIRGIYILIATSGRDGKEKKRGAALPVIPHPREKRAATLLLLFLLSHSLVDTNITRPWFIVGKRMFREKPCVFVYYIELYAMKFKIIYSCNRCTNHCDCTSSNMMESV